MTRSWTFLNTEQAVPNINTSIEVRCSAASVINDELFREAVTQLLYTTAAAAAPGIHWPQNYAAAAVDVVNNAREVLVNAACTRRSHQARLYTV